MAESGIRARLRSVSRKGWEFESPHAHQAIPTSDAVGLRRGRRRVLIGYMKYFRTSLLVLALFSIMGSTAHAQSKLSADDQKQIDGLFSTITEAVRVSGIDGTDMLDEITATDAREGLSHDIFFGLPFSGNVTSFELTNRAQVASGSADSSVVKFTATFTIDSKDRTGSSEAFFTFKKEEGSWYLFDTDFYKYFDSRFSSQFAEATTSAMAQDASDSDGLGALAFVLGGGIVLILGMLLVALLAGIFWVWMLIAACVRPEYHNKPFWILVIIFVGPVAAAFYYFMEHRPYKKSQTVVAMPVAPVVAPAPAPASSAQLDVPMPPAPPAA